MESSGDSTAKLAIDTRSMPMEAEFAALAGVGSDPLIDLQWHLINTSFPGIDLNLTSVWNEYQGTGVVVGIVDDGIDFLHDELSGNYNHELDFDARDNDFEAYPDTSTPDSGDDHGTAVAGVIAAESGNSYGGLGVASAAEITGFRTGFGAAGDLNQFTAAVSRFWQVDIANNSWGFGGFFIDDFSNPDFAGLASGLEQAVTLGRGGLGTVVVFSAGNGRQEGQDTNYHSMVGAPETIAVAAIGINGDIASFSTPGASVLVSAPGVDIVTTDRPGEAGFVTGDFVSISGTSFAAPAVVGVAALMLEANPSLGYRDVQEILAYSSRNPSSSEVGWQSNGADNWNGGGLRVSHDYGYGLVDAHAAVRLAETWSSQHTAFNLQRVTLGAATNQAILDHQTTSASVTYSGPALAIDQVQVDVNILHSWIGDLVITLTSPDGTTSTLVDRPANGLLNQDNLSFTFDSVQFWSEDGVGTWTLQVTDNATFDTGVLIDWTLNLLGDVEGPDDVYVYTDSFGRLAGQEGRGLLLDDGGQDSLNLAALSDSALVDLTPGAFSTIAGQPLRIDPGTLIEDVIAGDGADQVFGNQLANNLDGNRGDDLLKGSSGNDSLAGGAGNDMLYGNQDQDNLLGEAGDDILRGSRGGDTLRGGTGGDSLSGGTGDDELRGGWDSDSVDGGDGNDRMFGGRESDSLDGGSGNDSYAGLDGADQFFFSGLATGFDVIADFVPGEDRIIVDRSVNGGNLAGENDLLARLSGDGAGGSFLDLGQGHGVAIAGIPPQGLGLGDFVII